VTLIGVRCSGEAVRCAVTMISPSLDGSARVAAAVVAVPDWANAGWENKGKAAAVASNSL
jgi:hypothetical protein